MEKEFIILMMVENMRALGPITKKVASDDCSLLIKNGMKANLQMDFLMEMGRITMKVAMNIRASGLKE